MVKEMLSQGKPIKHGANVFYALMNSGAKAIGLNKITPEIMSKIVASYVIQNMVKQSQMNEDKKNPNYSSLGDLVDQFKKDNNWTSKTVLSPGIQDLIDYAQKLKDDVAAIIADKAAIPGLKKSIKHNRAVAKTWERAGDAGDEHSSPGCYRNMDHYNDLADGFQKILYNKEGDIPIRQCDEGSISCGLMALESDSRVKAANSQHVIKSSVDVLQQISSNAHIISSMKI